MNSGWDVEKAADSKSLSGGKSNPSVEVVDTLAGNKPRTQVVPLDLGGGAADVAAEGNSQHFSMLGLLGISYAILNSWAANASSIYIGLNSGGPAGVLWGTLTATLGATANAASLSELCHVWPTQGAHYNWTFALYGNNKRFTYYLTTMVGFVCLAGWIALSSTAPLLAGQFVDAVVNLYYPDWVPTDWSMFCVYMFLTIYATLVTIFGSRILDLFNRVSLAWSIIGFIAIFIALLACSNTRLRDGKWIFGTLLNNTGWPDGVAWIMALMQAQYSLVGADGAAHLVTEIPKPSWNAPFAMVASCIIGGATSFILMIAVLASIQDPEAVVKAGGGGILIVIYQSLKNLGGTIFLGLVSFGTLLFTLPALMTTTSRMIQAFALDNNLPGRKWLGHTNPRLESPVWAILFNFFWLIVFGVLIFAPSPVILPSIQQASVVLLQMSYMPPVIAMLLWGRKEFASRGVVRRWTLGRFGPLINVICLGYLLLTSVLFCFPSTYPVTKGSEMNYACVVIAVVFVLGTGNYFAWARSHFHGPSEFFTGPVRLQPLYPQMN